MLGLGNQLYHVQAPSCLSYLPIEGNQRVVGFTFFKCALLLLFFWGELGPAKAFLAPMPRFGLLKRILPSRPGPGRAPRRRRRRRRPHPARRAGAKLPAGGVEAEVAPPPSLCPPKSGTSLREPSELRVLKGRAIRCSSEFCLLGFSRRLLGGVGGALSSAIAHPWILVCFN